MTSFTPLDTWDIIARLLVATISGCLLGLNREMLGKPAGLRTHALVSLGSALMAVTILNMPGENANDALSRVMQGVVTGIGFLGAGVILQRRSGIVTGLTTAAMVWTAAILGLAAGAGHWLEVLIATVLIFLVLLLERWEGHIREAGPARGKGGEVVREGKNDREGTGEGRNDDRRGTDET